MAIYTFASYLNPLADFAKTETDERILMSWDLGGKIVRLIRLDNQLIYELTHSSREGKIRGPVNIPKDQSLEQVIEQLSHKDVIVEDNDEVSFVPKIFTSKLDSYSIIDKDRWAVTLVDIGSSESDCSSWGGHAALFVETVENNVHKLTMMHLSKDKKSKDPYGCKIKMLDIEQFRSNGIKSKTVTWIRSKNLIQNMIDIISKQQLDLEKGGKPFRMNVRGQNALGMRKGFHSCYTWAIRPLKIANIHLWEDPIIGIPSIVIIPKSLISPTSLSSKEKIIVQIDGSDIKKLDITQEIDAFVEHRPWKLALNNKDEIENIIIDCTVYWCDHIRHIGIRTTIIKLIVDHEVLEIDATEIIKQKMLKEIEKNDNAAPIDRIADSIIDAAFGIVFAVPLMVLDLLPSKKE